MLAEGIPAERKRVGNIMLDSFERERAKIETTTSRANWSSRHAVTSSSRHTGRPNVDSSENLAGLVDALEWAQTELPLVSRFTRARLHAWKKLPCASDSKSPELY
jgi:hypothetical protein